MLQQILADMYVDPDVLEALNEEQKKILFFKMREEQVRRWKEREEKEGNEGIKKEKLRLKKGTCKSVSWLLGHDGEVHVCIIGESDELESPKHILSELRNFNHFNRTKAEAAKSHQTKENRSDTGIQLLLQKPKELEASGTVTNDLKQDSGSDQSADETKGLTDDSDSGSAEDDTGLYRSHLSNRSTTVADTLREIKLQRAMNERLSIKEKTRPQDTVPPEKGLLRAEHGSMTYGSRVAQLRKTFNSSNAPCAKPPIPCKPAHLLTPPTVR